MVFIALCHILAVRWIPRAAEEVLKLILNAPKLHLYDTAHFTLLFVTLSEFWAFK